MFCFLREDHRKRAFDAAANVWKKSVITPRSAARGADDSSVLENLEMVRDRRLVEPEARSKVANAHLVLGAR